MKTITILTPDNIEVEYKTAGLGARIAAFIIDFLIQCLAAILCGGVLLAIDWFAVFDMRSSTLVAIILVIVFTIHFGYYIVCEMAMNGQSVGKRLFGMRVICDNGQPIGFSQSLIRGIIRATLDTMYIGFFVILFSKKNKRVGDMAAGTIVVIERYDDKFFDANFTELTHNFPSFLPPLSEMTAEERAFTESWLRRRLDFSDFGDGVESNLKKYFNVKSKQNPNNSSTQPQPNNFL